MEQKKLDSLDCIKVLKEETSKESNKGNQNELLPEDSEEPSYQLVPSSKDSTSNEANHVSSFGAGGRISQVVDPQFRQPNPEPPASATSVFSSSTTANAYFQPTTALSSSSVSVPQVIVFEDQNSSLIPPLAPPPQDAPSTNVLSEGSFATTSTPISFSDIAIKQTTTSQSSTPSIEAPPSIQPSRHTSVTNPSSSSSSSSSTMNLMSSTLNEYGPVTGPPHREPIIGFIPNFPPPPPPTSAPIFGNRITGDFTLGPYIPPTSTSKTSTLSVNKTTKPADEPLYSPPLPSISPPLDQIPNSTSTSSSTALVVAPSQSSSQVALATNKIPKKTNPSHDGIEKLDLIKLQKKYRTVESDQKYFIKKRTEAEKKLNDMARKAHGKNIEYDPNFKAAKEDKQKIDAEIQKAKIALQKISDVLSTKFNYSIVPIATNTQPKRAKMSTGGSNRPEPKEQLTKSEAVKKLMFDLRDTKTWCESCDLHFDTIPDYCQHLHTREHSRTMKKGATPWRSHMEPIDECKTYDLFKSICAKVHNELDVEFSIRDYDRVMNPKASNQQIKDLFLARERSRPRKEDPLFEPKGLNFLVPVMGYYCTLCNRTLCDQVEVNLHLRNHEHNYAYVKNVALNQQFETTLRVKYLNSLKSQSGSDADNDKQSTIQPKSILKNSTREVAKTSFSKPAEPPIKSGWVPGIIPISASRSKPAALKRLRTETLSSRPSKALKQTPANDDDLLERKSEVESEKRPKVTREDSKKKDEEIKKQAKEDKAEEVEEEVEEENDIEVPEIDYDKLYNNDDDDDEVQIITQVTLTSGDPDSPFPDLDLSVTGNDHLDLLKDKRLSKPSKVVMNRINLDDYKDMLLDSTTLWARVNQLITKKEPGVLQKDLCDKVITKPTYFNTAGELLPVDVEIDSARKEKKNIVKEELEDGKFRGKRKLTEKKSEKNDDKSAKNSNHSDDKRFKSSSEVEKDKEVELLSKAREDSISPFNIKSGTDSDDELGSEKKPVDLAYLETFFCDN